MDKKKIQLKNRKSDQWEDLVTELISGEKTTYRGHEILEIYKTKAECSKCGHVGALYKD